tara:strand:- start:1033 stop:1956 length:924 start_codon:yes stop_codon:yes gene_type:complete
MQNDYLQLNNNKKIFLIRKVLSLGALILKKKKILEPKHEARLLIAKELDRNESFVILNDNFKISQKKKFIFLKNIYKRCCGKPISRIRGKREFYSRDFFINKFTLDPRPESEFLVDITLELINRIKKKRINILDLGTGSGCLIISILLEARNKSKKIIDASGVDICAKSLEVAKKNGKKFYLEDKIKFYKSNWFSNVENKFDIIVSNPPYIKSDDIKFLSDSVKKYDPRIALDGGISGLQCYQNIKRNLEKYLNNNGFLCLELGNNKIKEINKIFVNDGLKFYQDYTDYSDITRNVVFQLRKKDLKK